MKFAWIALAYLAVLCLLFLLNQRDFQRCPEKGVRYRALPLTYKLGCWCGVVPAFVAAAFVSGAFFFVAFIGGVVLEGLCVRWYERNGFLPRVDRSGV